MKHCALHGENKGASKGSHLPLCKQPWCGCPRNQGNCRQARAPLPVKDKCGHLGKGLVQPGKFQDHGEEA